MKNKIFNFCFLFQKLNYFKDQNLSSKQRKINTFDFNVNLYKAKLSLSLKLRYQTKQK